MLHIQMKSLLGMSMLSTAIRDSLQLLPLQQTLGWKIDSAYKVSESQSLSQQFDNAMYKQPNFSPLKGQVLT